MMAHDATHLPIPILQHAAILGINRSLLVRVTAEGQAGVDFVVEGAAEGFADALFIIIIIIISSSTCFEFCGAWLLGKGEMD